MNPLYQFMIFCLQVFAIAFAGSFAIVRLFPDVFPSVVVQYAFPIVFGVVFVVGAIDQVFIYPFYRSPLRHLPTIKEKNRGGIVMESPRGKTPLQWMKTFPDAEIILVYGPLNVPMLILSGANSLRDVLNTRPYEFVKSWGVRSFLARIIGFGLILSEGAAHKKQRKALTPSFHIRRIRELYSLMWEKTGILLRELQKDIDKHPLGNGKGGKIEMSEWASRLTLDIIGPTAMGRDFDSLRHEDNRVAAAFLEILDPSTARLAFLGFHFIIPEWIMRRLPIDINKMLNRETGYLRGLCREIVTEKKTELLKNEKLSEFDILSRIIQTGEFTDSEVIDQMLTFLAAGHETTASALTWTCYLCARYPHVQEKLRAEIRERIPSSDAPITWELLEGMPYLNGVCEEVQRLYPTVPATIREAIVDTEIAGQPIPKDTISVLVPHAINRHPKFWGADADDMVPERWIDTAEDGTQRPNKNGGASTNFAEITFLHGPRSCIGRDFAKAELRCAVAAVVGKFRIELTSEVEPRVTGVITTKPDGGMFSNLCPVDNW